MSYTDRGLQVILKRIIYAVVGISLQEARTIVPILQSQFTVMMKDPVLFEDRFQKRCGEVLYDFISLDAGAFLDLTTFLLQRRVVGIELFEGVRMESLLKVMTMQHVHLYLNLLGLWYYAKLSKKNELIIAVKDYVEKLYNDESRLALENMGDPMVHKVLLRIHRDIL